MKIKFKRDTYVDTFCTKTGQKSPKYRAFLKDSIYEVTGICPVSMNDGGSRVILLLPDGQSTDWIKEFACFTRIQEQQTFDNLKVGEWVGVALKKDPDYTFFGAISEILPDRILFLVSAFGDRLTVSPDNTKILSPEELKTNEKIRTSLQKRKEKIDQALEAYNKLCSSSE
jgi:hypothetical protein